MYGTARRASVRFYRVLAFESSCDDACIALLEKSPSLRFPVVIDEVKHTLDSKEVGGVIPTKAHEHHQQHIPLLAREFFAKHSISAASPPGLICVTRGPGMVGSLSASLQYAKGLAEAWERPLIGVHHMVGHLLAAHLPQGTPQGTNDTTLSRRDKTNLSGTDDFDPPKFPFLSLLCSGGHTMLVLLRSLADHKVLINTVDIAAGDAIDKCARQLGLRGNMLGPELEKLAESIDSDTRKKFESINVHDGKNEYFFRLSQPFRSPKHAKVPENVQFAFAAYSSTLDKHLARAKILRPDHRLFLANKLQSGIFEHIVNRIQVACLKHDERGDNLLEGVSDFVCSGGVAANKVLRQKLQLAFPGFKFHFPPLALCTDNATMIGNAGIEVFEQWRRKSSPDILPIAKWPMNGFAASEGWEDVSDEEYERVTK